MEGKTVKKLLVVVNVFGKYQDYIPLYVLSWLRAYPDVNLRVYLNDALNPDIQAQLDMLGVSDSVTMVEYVGTLVGLTQKAIQHKEISKCIRWLIYEPIFDEYEAIYIGDVDIIIAKEEESLYNQHMRHCDFLNLPYSNIVRTRRIPNQALPLEVARNIVRCGFREALRSVPVGSQTLYRLSGLHFIKTEPYYQSIKPVLREFVQHLNLMAEGKRGKYNICTFRTNEAMLFDMVKTAELRTPENTENGSDDVENPETEAFRPHHGIHLAPFRKASTEKNIFVGSLKSELYKKYYGDFRDLTNSNSYKDLEKHLSPFINEQIQGVHDYYSWLT